MGFAANFTAIDFETASRRTDSACQLAAVVVREGQIVDQTMWMIRPEPFYFSQSNIRIHGITPQTVSDEPSFGMLWPDIARTLGSDVLVAHNASFDIGVLRGCLVAHGQSIPDLQFTCTRSIARRTWPHRPRFGLKPLATWLGIQFKHHDALEDSVACAKILLAAGIDREAESLEDLEKQLRLSRGHAGHWGYRGPSGRSKRTAERKPSSTAKKQEKTSIVADQPMLPFLFPDQIRRSDSPNRGSRKVRSTSDRYEINSPPAQTGDESTPTGIDLQRLMLRAEFIRPLSGKQIVFSGRLRSLDSTQASELAARSGGSCQSSIDEKTDLLILGDEKSSTEPAREAAELLRKRGLPIQIVSEDEFLSLMISMSN
ncbi:MAG: exonuclease domain-containing protein [Rubripirellula sp.]